MFGLFKKKSKMTILEEKHKRILKEAYDLSTIDRKKSHLKYAEAEAVSLEIETLQKSSTDH